VRGQEHDGQRLVSLAHGPQGLEVVHPRPGEVGDDDVDAVEQRRRLGGVAREHRLVAARIEQPSSGESMPGSLSTNRTRAMSLLRK
jgi:hypothetical protein